MGVDGSDDGKVAISEGRMLASAAQQPFEIGAQSVLTGYKLVAGEEVEKDVKIATTLVDSTNCNE